MSTNYFSVQHAPMIITNGAPLSVEKDFNASSCVVPLGQPNVHLCQICCCLLEKGRTLINLRIAINDRSINGPTSRRTDIVKTRVSSIFDSCWRKEVSNFCLRQFEQVEPFCEHYGPDVDINTENSLDNSGCNETMQKVLGSIF